MGLVLPGPVDAGVFLSAMLSQELDAFFVTRYPDGVQVAHLILSLLAIEPHCSSGKTGIPPNVKEKKLAK
jgi:hypothetical protein